MGYKGRILGISMMCTLLGGFFFYQFSISGQNMVIELIVITILLVFSWYLGKEWDQKRFEVKEYKEKKEQRVKTDDMFERMMDHASQFLFIHNDQQILYVNPATIDMLGASDAREITGHSLSDFSLTYDVESRDDISDVCFMNQQVKRLNGEYETIRMMSIPIIFKQQAAIMCIGIKDADSSKTHQQFININDALNESTIIAITNRQGVITYANQMFCDISQYKQEELIGQTHRIIHSNHHSKEFFKDIWRTICEGNVWKGEIKNRAKDGSHYWVDTTIVPILDHNQKPYQYVAIRHNITKSKEMEESRERLANYDPLTQLPNRYNVSQYLARALRDVRIGKQLAVMFVDFDGFKLYNDTYGHSFGDELLKSVAERLQETVAKYGKIGRYAGDEFLIIVNNTDRKNVERIAKRINKEFETPFIVMGRELFITLSIGISLYPFDGLDSETLIKNADTAMYRIKRLEKNGCSFFEEKYKHSNLTKINIENGIRKALRNDEFRLLYQPKIDLKTNTIVGTEALVRWESPEWGTVSPGKFISIAEETGLIVPLSKWVLHTACHQAKQWHNQGLTLNVAVNISVRQFYLENVVATVSDVLRETGLNPKHLTLEITESIFQDVVKSKRILQQLKEMGITISIDDFGTGYSSLSILNQLPIDQLKVDKSFIDDVPENENAVTLVKTIMNMGKHLGFEMVAEGIEDIEQETFLKKHECDIVQGYYYSKPVSPMEIQTYYYLRQGG
ncbi:diguanylate cyclase [Pontibacillus litoralis JSM 072002]|uniref:Diguanylate cyclase n=2 Tax=Pontibacillus TaxID=289201 RepID=A0A0A5G618_9BACI|nr:diguanylate cyclase [Pontibacillus litoralis JSM 072002]